MGPTEMDDAYTRYYQLVLIWIRDAAMFAEYLRLLPPVVARYGGAGDRSFEPTAIRADGLTLPQIVNLVHYDSKQAYQRFTEDPDFHAIEQLRSESVDLMSFQGHLRHADPSPERLAERIYHIDITTRVDSAGGEHAPPALGSAGRHIEYLLDVEPGTDGSDLAVISYRLSTDPHPTAPPSTGHIQLFARIHPATLPPTRATVDPGAGAVIRSP